mgnify:CR=1 FL=1
MLIIILLHVLDSSYCFQRYVINLVSVNIWSLSIQILINNNHWCKYLDPTPLLGVILSTHCICMKKPIFMRGHPSWYCSSSMPLNMQILNHHNNHKIQGMWGTKVYRTYPTCGSNYSFIQNHVKILILWKDKWVKLWKLWNEDSLSWLKTKQKRGCSQILFHYDYDWEDNFLMNF